MTLKTTQPTAARVRLIVFGASGFVGQQLVPCLTDLGCELVLVGRDLQRLQTLFPEHEVSDYQGWNAQPGRFTAALNLAVVNNDCGAAWGQFEAANVDLPVQLAKAAQAAGIPRFIQFSSQHALDASNSSAYARSKRLAQESLATIAGIEVSTLYYPLVWGERWSGSLDLLNRLPVAVATALFSPMAALKPTAHIDLVARSVLRSVERGGGEIVISDDMDKNVWYRGLSALVDYGFALSVLLGASWLLFLIAVAIRFTSHGPAIFAQARVGKNGQVFTCYKFRTMRLGTPQAGTHEVSSNAVTPVGSFLRRTKLDELPQVWNILRGEIRLVGPRPGLPVQESLHQARMEAGVFDMMPGITGWAQIHDVDMSDPQRLVRWDARYKAMRSILLDSRIILATLLGRGRSDRVRGVDDLSTRG